MNFPETPNNLVSASKFVTITEEHIDKKELMTNMLRKSRLPQETIDAIITSEYIRNLQQINTMIVANTFTETEINTMIEFYTSSTGQSLLKKTQSMTMEITSQVHKMTFNYIEELMDTKRRAQ